MTYLAWHDPNPKKPPAQKIAEASARHKEKFGTPPIVCLCHPDDACEVEGVEVRPLRHISRNCFWVGADDPQEGAQ